MTTSELAPERYQDVPWTDLMPWLKEYGEGTVWALSGYTPSSDWWLTESPAVTSMVVPHRKMCDAIAYLIIADRSEAKFADLLPLLPPHLPVSALEVGTLARTALERLGARAVRQILEVAPSGLFKIRGTGPDAVEDIVGALVGVAITKRPEITPLSDTDDAGRRDRWEASEATRSAVHEQLLDDLVQLGRWRSLRGRADEPLLDLVVEDGAPEQIQEAALRLNSLAASDVAGRPAQTDPVTELTSFFSELDDVELAVLRGRFLADPPANFFDLANELSLSRSQARQIEADLKAALLHSLGFGTAVGNLLGSMRVEIQPVASIDRLVHRHADLQRPVADFGVPLWYVLDRLDDYFEVTDGWAAAPDVEVARDKTRTLLENLADAHGAAQLDAVSVTFRMPRQELVSWLTYCGHRITGDSVLTRTATMNDHAAGILSSCGAALATDELAERLGRGFSLDALTAALSEDDRFNQSQSGVWALASWPSQESAQIRRRINGQLSASGGSLPIHDIVAAVARELTVPEADVIAQAVTGEFEIVGGTVRRRNEEKAGAKPLAETRRVFKEGDAWKLRIDVTRDHLRGSDFPIPTAIAHFVDCAPDRSVELDSWLGVQSVRWTGAQPSCGTIKRFLDRAGAVEGSLAFLVFHPDMRFDVDVIDPAMEGGSASALDRALMLVGAVDANGEPMLQLAGALGLPSDPTPQEVIRFLYRRGDEDIASLLEAAWGAPPQSAPPPDGVEEFVSPPTSRRPSEDEYTDAELRIAIRQRLADDVDWEVDGLVAAVLASLGHEESDDLLRGRIRSAIDDLIALERTRPQRNRQGRSEFKYADVRTQGGRLRGEAPRRDSSGGSGPVRR